MKRPAIIVIVSIMILFACSFVTDRAEQTNIVVLPSSAKILDIDLVGSDRQELITEKQAIQKIAGILNSFDLKPMRRMDEGKLLLSSRGGYRIVPDNNENQAIYIHGEGVIYISESLQHQLNFDTNVCYIAEDKIKELSIFLQEYIRNDVLTKTRAALERAYPSTTNIGKPILCAYAIAYEVSQTTVLIKREVKDADPLLIYCILDANYNIIKEICREVPKTVSYTAYSVYYDDMTITFGIAGIDAASAKIEYNNNKDGSSPQKLMTKHGYMFGIGHTVLPTGISFYDDKGELLADQNDVGPWLLYDDASKNYIKLFE